MTFEKRHRVRKQAAQISGGGACQEGKGLGQECSRDGKVSSVTGVERGPRLLSCATLQAMMRTEVLTLWEVGATAGL